jgi:hypothetical protein
MRAFLQYSLGAGIAVVLVGAMAHHALTSVAQGISNALSKPIISISAN